MRKNFARNLVKLRDQFKLTQAELANTLNDRYDINLKRASVANYESEEAMPKIDALYCIANYFGKTIDQLISDNPDQAPLIHPWLFREQPDHPGDLPGARVPQAKSNCPGVDTLLTEYAEAIAMRQFYTEFMKRLLAQLLQHSDELRNPEQITQLFSRTYLGCLLSKSKFLDDRLRFQLDDREYEVFRGIHEGGSVRTLSEALQLPENEVLTTFNIAKTKILAAIDQSQNE